MQRDPHSVKRIYPREGSGRGARLPRAAAWRRWLPRRRLPRIALLAGVGLLLLILAAVLATPALGRWYVARRVLPMVGQRLGRTVAVERVVFGLRQIALEGVTLRGPVDESSAPLVRLDRVEIAYRLGALLGGRLEVQRARAEGTRLHLLRRADGTTNFLDLLRRAGRRGGASRLRVHELSLGPGSVTVEDRQGQVVFQARMTGARLLPSGESVLRLGATSITSPRLRSAVSFARVQLRGRRGARGLRRLSEVRLAGGRVRLLPRLELSGIQGRIAPDGSGERVRLELAGSYGGAEAKLWSATGWIDPHQRRGEMRVRAERFSLGRIASILTRTPVIEPAKTLVDSELTLSFARGVLAFGGGLEVTGLNLFHPGLARAPVLGLAGRARLEGALDTTKDTLRLARLDLRSGALEVQLQGTVERLSQQPLVEVRLTVPPVLCQTVLDTFPAALLPGLQGFGLKGTFAVDLHSRVDFTDLKEVELGGKVGINRCKVTAAPETMHVDRLQNAFEQTVEPFPGQPLTFTVGPESEDFVPFTEISPYVVRAFLTTEDAGFFRHRGFIPSQFRAALARNLQRGGFRLGASTISMQMVKNVLLSHEKTLSRKLQELFLTWYLEQHLTKDRLMEIYLNVIEFGPGIYGVGAAARHYFGKPAKEITPLEAAFFASILPSPKRRYVHYCRGKLTESWDRYVRRLLRRMVEKGHVDAATAAAAEEQQITFVRDLEALSEEDCLRQVKELLEAWEEEGHRRLRETVRQAAPHQLELYLPAGQPPAPR